jgi:PAS domain S-box-containing protein
MNKIISLNDLWVIYNLPSHFVAVLNLQGAFEHVNASLASWLGYWEESLVGNAFESIVHPDDHPEEILEFFRNDGESYSLHAIKRMRGSDGNYRYFSWSFTKLADKEFIYAIAQDCAAAVRNGEHPASSTVTTTSENIPGTDKPINGSATRKQQGILDRNDMLKNIAWKQSHLIRSPLANLKGLLVILKEDPASVQVMEYLQTELEKLDNVIKEIVYETSVLVALGKHSG